MATTLTRSEPIHLLLVDDHPAVREAVRRRLELVPRFQEVREAGGICEAITQLDATPPQLAVIDIDLRKNHRGERESGLFLARVIHKRYPATRTLIWSMYDSPDYVAEAKAAGARGYILKGCPMDEVVRAIEVVLDGGCYYSGDLEQEEAESKSQLTMRETQVLTLVANGKTSRQIAKQLKIKSCRTVETHRRNLMSKLDAKNPVDLMIIAFRLGLIDFMAWDRAHRDKQPPDRS
ncbi:MAG TPA: response regulator transcription factor [Kofleriaceae bacterium]